MTLVDSYALFVKLLQMKSNLVLYVAVAVHSLRIRSIRMRWTYRVSIEMVLIFLAMKQWSDSARSVSTAVAIAPFTSTLSSRSSLPSVINRAVVAFMKSVLIACFIRTRFVRLRSTLLTLFVEIPREFGSTNPWIVHFNNKTSQGALNVDIYVKSDRWCHMCRDAGYMIIDEE